MNHTHQSYYIGLDLGTSSVKCLALSPEGETVKKKVGYSEISKSGWREAVLEALRSLSLEIGRENIAAIGLSSQVGTYITDREIIGWNASAGRDELKRIKSEISKEEFLSEISMNHPDLISYPLPRLLYIKENIQKSGKVIMPKEYLTELLCGVTVSDQFSYRGLYNFTQGKLSDNLLKRFGLDFELPKILDPTDLAGKITKEASEKSGIPEGTPVYTGCNDFFAGLLGMGITKPGAVFDLSGTSEHIGIIGEKLTDTDMVSGNYFNGFCTYGGTKSSGVSCDFAIEHFSLETLDQVTDVNEILCHKPPIFLPYLTGERAPIFDENARGVFFGISSETGKREMAYAVIEGVLFSLYDIFLRLDPKGVYQNAPALITGGGSAGNRFMAKLKAELFGMKVTLAKEPDTSAMGAAILAAVGHGEFADLDSAVRATVSSEVIALPTDEALGKKLKERFFLYRSLYHSLKGEFERFSTLG